MASPAKAPFSDMGNFTAYNGATRRRVNYFSTRHAGMCSGAIQVISVNNQNQNIMKSYIINYRRLNIGIHESQLGGVYFRGIQHQSVGEAFESAVKYVDSLYETKYHSVDAFNDAVMKHAFKVNVKKGGEAYLDNQVLAILLDNYEPK